jgi:FkbM family methyltransferase
MSLSHLTRRFGNELYKVAFPIYRPLYSSFKSYADRSERRLLADNLGDGSVVVDAGANVGIYSEFLSKCVGLTGVVHSFEPDPDNFTRLYAALCNVPNVRLNQLAVSDKTGESLLYISKELNVDHRAYPTEGETRKAISIQSTTLDNYFPPGERVDLIKMDIQGYELHALRGAERVLADNPRVILLLEFWPFGLKQAGTSGTAVASFLRARRFSLFQPTAAGLVSCKFPIADDQDPSSYTNLFVERVEGKQRAPAEKWA